MRSGVTVYHNWFCVEISTNVSIDACIRNEILLTFWYVVGPSVVSNEARTAELEVSLLERLFERPLYADHKKNGGTKSIPMESNMLPYTTLVKVGIILKHGGAVHG